MSIARKILMSSGGKKDSTYVDDVFSTYLYKGNATNRSIVNGIDLAGEGGLVWIKNRTAAWRNRLNDTVRGAGKEIKSDTNQAENTATTSLTQFNNNGFDLGIHNDVNRSGDNHASWTFRKQKGFFDIVTWTQSGSDGAARTLDHNLGCVPGFIMLKQTTGTENWICWHRDLGTDQALKLNGTEAAFGDNNSSVNSVSSTQFVVGADNNKVGSYVAYLFAGGESTAATARSVDFNGSSYLDIADHSDFTFGTDDFTIECWYKADDTNLSSNWDYIFSSGWPVQLGHTVDGANTNSRFSFYMADSNSTSSYIVSNLHTGNGSVYGGQWYHVAVTRSGSTFRIFLNGELKNTATSSGSAPAPNTNSALGRFGPSAAYYADGKISNFRYVKGTAVYTESFRPPTEPLTAITNTKLLCCNNSSPTGSTITPGTITNNGATASTDSPFDDPEGFKFGKIGGENIIKCGSYTGNGSSSGPRIDLGWEPQWFIVKNTTSGSTNWLLFDSMRGLTDSDQTWEANIKPNSSDAEWDNEYLSPTSRGFRLTGTSTWVNQNGNKMIYIAIRFPDGYVGKPPEAGTDVFTMDTGAGSGVNPTFDSNFAVDMGIMRQPATTQNWFQSARILGDRYMYTDTNAAASSGGGSLFEYDYSKGWCNSSAVGSSGHLYQSWMWKRHAGFDVVTYNGSTASSLTLSHNLNAVPEMIILKCRSEAEDWRVYHKGLNGGTNPQDYYLKLNTDDAEANAASNWNDTAPTSTHFTVGNDGAVNNNNRTYIAMLFASVDGISKVGYYTGNGSTQTITTGFQPRFLLIKGATQGGSPYNWFCVDTLRGWPIPSGGDDKILYFNNNSAQAQWNIGAVASTGFELPNDGGVNANNERYIYYAHA